MLTQNPSKLNSPVLVLNAAWQPITVSSVKNSIIKVYNDMALFLDARTYTVHDFDSWVDYSLNVEDAKITSANGLQIAVPEIMVLKDFTLFPKRKVKLTRRNLLIRDNFTCQYSGKVLNPSDATIDHIIPQSKGGDNSWENMVICSVEINTKKADRTPEEANLSLLKKPTQPKWSPLYSKFARAVLSKSAPKSWMLFIKDINPKALEVENN